MTDKEKAEYYNQWYEYFEPLARIRSGVVKALPHYKKRYASVIEQTDDMDFLTGMLSTDDEINPEIQNLILKIIEDIEQTAPIQGG